MNIYPEQHDTKETISELNFQIGFAAFVIGGGIILTLIFVL